LVSGIVNHTLLFSVSYSREILYTLLIIASVSRVEPSTVLKILACFCLNADIVAFFNADQMINESGKSGADVCHDVISTAKLDGCALLCRQFHALFTKRFHYVLRSKKAFFSQVL